MVMICNKRVPCIASGLCLCLKHIKQSQNTNIDIQLVHYNTSKEALSIICAIVAQNRVPLSSIEVFWDRCNIGPNINVAILLSSLRLFFLGVVQWNNCISSRQLFLEIVPAIRQLFKVYQRFHKVVN